MEFLEVLIEGFERVLLVRGGGREVIIIYFWISIDLWIRVDAFRVKVFSRYLFISFVLFGFVLDLVLLGFFGDWVWVW